MSEKTTIAWTESTWNPLRARQPDEGQLAKVPRAGWSCVRVSPGCTHCYAATMNKRLGTRLDYTVPDNARVKHYVSEHQLLEPLRKWKSARRVFVCSMTDLFGEWVADEQLDHIFAVMALTPQHTYQVLTKRPERMRAYVTSRTPLGRYEAARRLLERQMVASIPGWTGHAIYTQPLPNVWIGVSAEDQQRADERIPLLLDTPAAVRWVSAEPLLGSIDFHGLGMPCCGVPYEDSRVQPDGSCDWCGHRYNPIDQLLDWIVVGGESGAKARPFDIVWARSIRNQCREAGVAFFMKQLGAKPTSVATRDAQDAARLLGESRARVARIGRLLDRKGEDPSEWPEDLRVREYPAVSS